jgi:hypothetical protein
MRKIIFLDIDGVLNTEIFVTHYFHLADKYGFDANNMRDDYGSLFDPRAVDLLKWVVESTGADIVISSTWRSSGLEIMQEMWAHRELPGKVVDVTPNFMRYTGSTLQRGKEIDSWLALNPDVTHYVIIDDDTDMEPHQLGNHFINTDAVYGITLQNALDCVNILNRETNE